MKINKFVEDLKAKSAAELNEELVAAKKELFNLRFQNATNQLDNTSRIKEVRKRLMDTENYSNYTIKAIAESVGYKSHANFVLIFKKYTGITPSMFQKMANK